MATPLLITGDTAEFPANCFTGATIAAMSVPVVGTGKASVGGKPVCVAGDEATVVVAGCTYTTTTHTIAGTGTLTIAALAAAQGSKAAISTNKAAILATDKFTARMTVLVPASVVVAGVTQTDPLTTYTGTGEFKSSNKKSSAGK